MKMKTINLFLSIAILLLAMISCHTSNPGDLHFGGLKPRPYTPISSAPIEMAWVGNGFELLDTSYDKIKKNLCTLNVKEATALKECIEFCRADPRMPPTMPSDAISAPQVMFFQNGELLTFVVGGSFHYPVSITNPELWEKTFNVLHPSMERLRKKQKIKIDNQDKEETLENDIQVKYYEK